MMDGYTFHPRMIKKVAKSIVMLSNTTLLVMAVPILLVVTFFSSHTTKSEEKKDDYLPTFVIKSDPSTTPTNTPIGSEDECESISSSFEGQYELIHIK